MGLLGRYRVPTSWAGGAGGHDRRIEARGASRKILDRRRGDIPDTDGAEDAVALRGRDSLACDQLPIAEAGAVSSTLPASSNESLRPKREDPRSRLVFGLCVSLW